MEEIVVSIRSMCAECLVAPIRQGAAYLFYFKLFIEELKNAEYGLIRRLNEVNEHKEQVARRSEEITCPVMDWLMQVHIILIEVELLRHKVEGGGKSCFNMSFRYSLAKQMDNMAKQMMELKNNSHFDPFSCLIPLPGVTYSSSKDFLSFNSRKPTYDRLLEAIKDGKKRMTGLYGMGGLGKTTLAKEVGKKVHELKLFDKIVMVVVSKPPNAEKIQQEIAEKIDFKFLDDIQSTRAQRLSERLKNMKILVILDDVWEWISLKDVGIPLAEGHHILLTTRQPNVCISMNCDPIIELPLIAKEEAWELFKKHANLFDDASGEFHDVGRKIIDECKELPFAIVIVGSSLKGKPIDAWKSALQKLKHSQPMNVEQGLRSPYECVKLSYDNLPSSTTKSLFLLCSMFPEDHAIQKEDLFRFSKGILELEISGTMEDAREEIAMALQILLDSCLLMSAAERACVKMHDLVRDVALWIARKQGEAILVDSHEISNISASNHPSWKDTKVLSLWNLEENFKLPNQMHCPTLEIMLLHPHGLVEDLEAIDALKVLALVTFNFTWEFFQWQILTDCSIIPPSIVSLGNLHTLCLRGKILGDISFLGELKGLEILDLRGSSFNELPAAIIDMKMLKLLDMFVCEIGKSPLEVIGRCKQLEELYFWDKRSSIPENFSLSRLKRYFIFDSTCDFDSYEVPFQKYLDSCDEALRFLCIQSFKVSALNSAMKDLIHSANLLCLENCGWVHKDINDGIKHSFVSSCRKKRFIIDRFNVNFLQTQQVFLHLVTLSLVEMKNLEQVFQDSSINRSLPMLQELRIQSCPALETCIFTCTTITSLPELRKLEIYDCNKVKWLFSSSIASNCPSLEKIIIENCSQLERLIDDDEDKQGNPLLDDKQNYPCGKEIDGATIVCFPKLEILRVVDCHKVKRLFSYSLASHCPSLKEIIIHDCFQLEGVVQAYEGEVTDYHHEMRLFPKLNHLNLRRLPNLREVYPSYEI